MFVLAMAFFVFVLCVFQLHALVRFLFLELVSTSANDCVQRLVSEMTYCVCHIGNKTILSQLTVPQLLRASC